MNYWRKVPATLRHLLLVTLLGLPLIAPLMRWGMVPCTHDGHLHVHRIAAMRHAWENGLYFTRWLPDLALGYGYPFFIYREPTPLYAVLGPHLLGLPLPAASNLFYAFCILASGWFMFLWVKDVSGPRAGILSAVAYMGAPYILLDALVRGNAPESLALPLLPLLLWIGRRWIIQGSAPTFLASVFSLAFLSLSHNISTFIFTPVLFIYLLVIAWLKKLGWQTLTIRLLLLFGLGLGMTLFYTGGALLEMDQVTLSQSTTTRNNDFHFNFASWSEILSPAAAEDPNLLNPPLPIRLGWIPTVLALLGLSTLFWKKDISREQREHIIMMGLAAFFFLFMSLPASLPIWEAVPLIDFVQFPWRFIGRAALPVAFLAGAPFALTNNAPDLAKRKSGFVPYLVLLAAAGLLILESLPNLYPRYCPENLFPTIVDVHAYEQATGLVGVDPEGSYFPRTVQKRPSDSPLLADYENGQTPQRFDMDVLPPGATADVQYSPLAAEAVVNSPDAFTARYLSFAFPGWRAEVDGVEVPITPSDPAGLITFPVMSGEHRIEIRWQPTLLRTFLSLLSVLAFAGVVATAVLLYRKHQPPIEGDDRVNQVIPEYWLLVILGLSLLLFKLLAVDRGITPINRGGAAVVENPMMLQAEGQQFEGYTLPSENTISGQTFDIDLAWTTLETTNRVLQSNIWLAGPDSLLWSDKETQRPRLFEDPPPTRERGAGQWVWDSREIQVLPGTPPGEYDLVLTLFDLETLAPLTFTGSDGSVVGPTAVIGQVTVQPSDDPVEVNPQYSRQEIVPATGLILTGYNQDRETAAPGDLLLLTLFWQPEGGPVAETFTLQLLDEDGQVAHSWQLPILHSAVGDPWIEGSPLRRQIALQLPADLESGVYQFFLQASIPLGTVSIDAPQRIFDLPEIAVPIQETFDGKVALEGYNVLDDSPYTVTFIWRALAEMDQAYHVFVHLVDESGRIIAQSDGQPANWTRPTTGWVPGEFIIDAHDLALPEEGSLHGLRLRVGLYEPESNQRLSVGERDFVEIPLSE